MSKKWTIITFILLFSVAVFFRTYKITGNPPGLYWEEVALGYDAYSLLKTGADHHGNVLPIIALESFGDWKPALYAYLIIPFITLFDLGSLAVRLPSMLAGISIVIGSYFFAKRLGQRPLVSMAVAAIAPWAIHFSRAGWESHVSAAFIFWGLYCGVQSVGKKLKFGWALASVILLGLSLYTYHAARIIVPLLAVGLIVYVFAILRKNKISTKKFFTENLIKLVGLTVVVLLLITPFLQNLNSPALLQRGKETSIFTDISVIEESNTLRENSGYSLLSRVLYHRYVLFGKEILKNYSSHFNLDFLFISGDKQPRHSPQFFGHLYHIEFIFPIFGIVSWYKKRSAEKSLVVFWLLVSIIPGSITYASPHALRMLAGFPVFVLLIASGIEYLYEQYKAWLGPSYKRLLPFFVLAVIGVYSVELASFWRHYTKIYTIEYASEWQVGYKEMIAKLNIAMQAHPELPVFVSRDMGRPAMYYWFYSKTDPKLVQAANAAAKK
ncbi:MAG: hypothetical protein COY80_04665, partial [Candidatus Pacebacteria bacterium CG_4_10_14_0_8_um_filter_42_14]